MEEDGESVLFSAEFPAGPEVGDRSLSLCCVVFMTVNTSSQFEPIKQAAHVPMQHMALWRKSYERVCGPATVHCNPAMSVMPSVRPPPGAPPAKLPANCVVGHPPVRSQDASASASAPMHPAPCGVSACKPQGLPSPGPRVLKSPPSLAADGVISAPTTPVRPNTAAAKAVAKVPLKVVQYRSPQFRPKLVPPPRKAPTGGDDSRRNNRGAPVRGRATLKEKVAVVLVYQDLMVETGNKATYQDVVDLFFDRYPLNTVKKWLSASSRSSLLQANIRGKGGRTQQRLTHPKPVMYPLAESATYDLYKDKRVRGRKVSKLWLQKTFKLEITKHYGADAKEDLKGNRGWLRKFLKRNKISKRRKTNCKSHTIAQRLPEIKSWHKGLKALIQDAGDRRVDTAVPVHAIEGRFLFKDRANFDEVPLAFVIEKGSTYADKGSKTVHIVQAGGASANKRMATLVVFCFGDGTLARTTVLFRGQGLRLRQTERDAWDKRVEVIFQKKAWMDDATALVYADKVLLPAFADRGFTDGQKNTEALMLMDNLHSHKTDAFTGTLKKRGVLSWFHSPNCTDVQQPVDAGLGRHIKVLYEQAQDLWLENEENIAKWERDDFSEWERRVLITQWVGDAHDKLAALPATITKCFLRTGCLMTADDSNDLKITVEGVPDYDFRSASDSLPAVVDDMGDSSSGTDDTDSSDLGSDDLGELSDEDDLDSVIPDGLEVASCPPSADITATLIGRKIVFRWNALGWAVGTVMHFHEPTKGGHKNLNFHVFYDVDGQGEDHHLSTSNYSGAADAPHGSWALLRQHEVKS